MGVLSAEFKNFSFKFIHGRLYLNQARAHFDAIHPCSTLCEKREKIRVRNNGMVLTDNEWAVLRNGLPHESIRHIFRECDTVKPILVRWLNELCQGVEEGNGIGREVNIINYWGGVHDFRKWRMKLGILIIKTL